MDRTLNVMGSGLQHKEPLLEQKSMICERLPEILEKIYSAFMAALWNCQHVSPPGPALQYTTLLYSTLLYSTLLYSTLLYSTLLCYTLPYHTHTYIYIYTILYFSLLDMAPLHVLVCARLYYTTLYFSVVGYILQTWGQRCLPVSWEGCAKANEPSKTPVSRT